MVITPSVFDIFFVIVIICKSILDNMIFIGRPVLGTLIATLGCGCIKILCQFLQISDMVRDANTQSPFLAVYT